MTRASTRTGSARPDRSGGKGGAAENGIAFAAATGDSGPLSWSQKSMWNNIQRIAPHDRHLNEFVTLRLRNAVSIARLEESVQALVVKHEALRTFYRFDGDGTPEQEVVASGSVPLVSLGDADGGQDAAASETLTARFDSAAELPLRIGVVRNGENAEQVLLALNHMSTDAHSNEILRRDLHSLLVGDVDPAAYLRTAVPQPLAVARTQQANQAAGMYAETYRYWGDVMDAVPKPPFALGTRTSAAPRFWHGRLDSRRMFAGTARIAKTERIAETSIVLGAMLLALGAELSCERFPIWIRVSNRFDPELRETVMYRCQNVPILVDVAANSLMEVARGVHRSMANLHRYSEYDPDVTAPLIPDPSQLPSITYNAIPRQLGVRPAPKDDRFRWIEKFDDEKITFFINAFTGQGLSLLADTTCLSPGQLESCLRSAADLIATEGDRISP
jgi:hypothetical protein